MKYTLTTSGFNFITVDFYQSVADPDIFFNHTYDEEESEDEDFDFPKYRNAFIPYIQQICDETAEILKKYRIKSIKAISVESPKEYNFETDWAMIEVEMDDDWKTKAVNEMVELSEDNDCKEFFKTNYKTRSGYIFRGPDTWSNLCYSLGSGDYTDEILLSMFLTLAYIHVSGYNNYNNWETVVDFASGNLNYENFIITKQK